MNSQWSRIAEVSFNIAYLIAIWILVTLMAKRRGRIEQSPQRKIGRLLFFAFGLLALGDTAHVGFRIVAYAVGDLEFEFEIGTLRASLIGVGALATSVTVTIFYAIFTELWVTGSGRNRGIFYWIMMIAVVARFVLFLFPENRWIEPVPPKTWSLVRNVPLLLHGVLVAVLFLNDGYRDRSQMFVGIGWMIVISFGCYVPVILFVQDLPAIGMLMIPKTVAYLGVAGIGYRWIFGSRSYLHSQSGATPSDSGEPPVVAPPTYHWMD